MQQKSGTSLTYACVAAGVLLLGACGGVQAQHNGDKGESRKYVALKNRRATPRTADIDRKVTLDGLLSSKDEEGWSTAKAAVVEGYVIQVEREEDGDRHIVLATNPGETDTTKWVIVEVTRAWSKRLGQLKKLHGKHVRVTGWLYYEPDNPSEDPRGTRWEIHPVTSLAILK